LGVSAWKDSPEFGGDLAFQRSERRETASGERFAAIKFFLALARVPDEGVKSPSVNLTTHLLKKDIRRSRGLLIAWLLLLILQGVLVSSSANPGAFVVQTVDPMISRMVPLFKALLLIVIVPFVVQDDPLVGTTAFWLTRPISRGTLLRTKALYAAVVLVLPTLAVEIIVLAANGITLHDLALAVPEILLGQIELIVIIAIVAAVTPTFGKYANAGAVGVIIWAPVMLAVFFGRAVNLSLAKSSSVAAGLVTISVFGGVVAHQYLSGRTFRSIIAGCAGIVAIFAVQFFWTWDFLSVPVRKNGVPPFDVSALKVALSQASGVGWGTRMQILAEIEATGGPSMYSLRPTHVQPHLKLSNGSELHLKEAPKRKFSSPLTVDPLVAALGGTPVTNREYWRGNESAISMLFMIDAETYEKYSNQPLNFSAEIDFIASKYQIAAEMPLAKGARSDRGSRHSVITEVSQGPDGVDVILREWTPNLLFDRSNGSDQDPTYRYVYVLRNQKRNEAMVQGLGYSSFGFDFDQILGLYGRLINRSVKLSFAPDRDSTAPRLGLHPSGSPAPN